MEDTTKFITDVSFYFLLNFNETSRKLSVYYLSEYEIRMRKLYELLSLYLKEL